MTVRSRGLRIICRLGEAGLSYIPTLTHSAGGWVCDINTNLLEPERDYNSFDGMPDTVPSGLHDGVDASIIPFHKKLMYRQVRFAKLTHLV